MEDWDWFDRARFGMFVHWDHASQQGLELSWPLVGGISVLPRCQSVGVEQYHSSAATFDPQSWDPAALARLAREAGMGYVVLTAKHHSGYAMWHTRCSDFSVEHSPYGRDIVAGFVDAVRAEGLRVGLYFSLSD
jgi:alpha-L-fucosidase